jgi:hypothetical protein
MLAFEFDPIRVGLYRIVSLGTTRIGIERRIPEANGKIS